MPSNRNRKYIVIAEVEQIGFATGYFTKYVDAVMRAKELQLLGDMFHFGEVEGIAAQLIVRDYKSYRISGNQLFFDRFSWITTDGNFTICVVKVDPPRFCLQTFAKERENYSIVFDDSLCKNERFNKFFLTYPLSTFCAN